MSHTLEARQKQLERASIKEGVQKFRDKGLSEFQQDLLQRCFYPLADAIKARQDEIVSSRSKAGVADFALLALGPDELSLVTLLSIVHSIAASKRDIDKRGKQAEATMRRTALRIGEHCKREFERECELSDNPMLKRLRNLLITRQDNNNAARRAEELIEKLREPEWWDTRRQLALGADLIDLACEHTNLFMQTHSALSHNENKKSKIIRLSDEGRTWLDALQNKRITSLKYAGSLALPMNLPMVVPPRKWDAENVGGYLVTHNALVKFNPENLVPKNTYDRGKMPEVLGAVNALQSTPWKINARLLAIYRDIWSKRSVCEKLFLPDGEQKIPAEVQAAIEMRIDHCDHFSGRPFYFPYQLDFRGRVYAVPQIINPQSEDATRALLQFADAAPCTDAAEFWTAVQAANYYGHDKLTLDGRYAWVHDNRSSIEALARNPLSQLDFLCAADEPWSFLAAACEWVDIHNGAAETWLPVYVDGRCNGLQHLSTISRDLQAARAVNVAPTEKPEDLYGEIAAALKAILSEETSAEAKYWLPRIERKTVKKPIMTTPYGVTRQGMFEQIKEATKHFKPAQHQVAFLRDRLVDTIYQRMTGPTEVQDWLQDVAGRLTNNEKPIAWNTPVGFPVIQDYRKPEFLRLKASKFTIRYFLPVDGEKEINTRQQRAGIVPNYVHSMDAAHLTRVVNRLAHTGVTHIAVVHDSFGVHAAHVPLMNSAIREEFVRLYENNVLDDLCEQLYESTGVPLIRFKKYGELDIQSVLKSTYFFS